KQLIIERCKCVDHRHRDQEIAASEANQVLDMSFLVGRPDQAEVRVEQVMTLELEEELSEHVTAPACEFGDGDSHIVVADSAGHPAEELEGFDVALLECLGTLAREGATENGITIRQRHHEDRSLEQLPANADHGVPKICLGVTRTMFQRHEDLRMLQLPGA